MKALLKTRFMRLTNCAILAAAIGLSASVANAHIYGPGPGSSVEDPVLHQDWWGGRFTNRTGGNVNDFHMRLHGFGTPTNIVPSGGVYTSSPPSIDWTFPDMGPGSTLDVGFDETLQLLPFDPSQPVVEKTICANWTLNGSPVGNGNAGLIESHWYTGPIDPVYPPIGPVGPNQVKLLLRYSVLCPSLHDAVNPLVPSPLIGVVHLLQRQAMADAWSDLDFSPGSPLRSDPELEVAGTFMFEQGFDVIPDLSTLEISSQDATQPDGFLVFIDFYANDGGMQGEYLSTVANGVQLSRPVPEPQLAGGLVAMLLFALARLRSRHVQ